MEVEAEAAWWFNAAKRMSGLFARYFLSKLLFVAWLAVTVGPVAVGMWLLEGNEKLHSAARWVSVPFGLVGFVVSWYLGGTTASYMLEENLTLVASVKRALLDLKLKLAFVPIIGAFFTPDEDKTKPDDDD